MKQDVYEHLAKTFLDKKKRKKRDKNLWVVIAISVIASIVLLSATTFILTKKKFFSRSLYVLNDKAPTLIEYDFTTLGNSKTKALSFNLNNIDLSKYHFINLSIRTQENTKINSTLKVQIENSLLEKDAQYISGINTKWQRASLPLDNFKLIKDWSKVKTLTFVVEDWNVSSKKNSVIIDDIHFAE
ncbi:MAG: hypothetical protein PHG69_03340 [Candidatus Omnitrophica bacterium]|nr:hypothetical protein [Candidatus Omnitrophota bacterium]